MNSDCAKIPLTKLYYLNKSNSVTKARNKSNVKHIIHYFPSGPRLYAFWCFLIERSSANTPSFLYVRKQTNKCNHIHASVTCLRT